MQKLKNIKAPIKTRLKVNDEVVVIGGKSRKQRGKILAIDKKRGRVIVQGVNLRKRYARPTQENPKGGILEIESPVHISNVSYYDAKEKKAAKIRMSIDKAGKKVRISSASGKEVD
ncbi:MAG: 50S ribosomal protein L24 [Spirochaetia bacterium]|nr:50S ribosomal protein L24 [Spirochaetia bacterium]